MCSLDLSRVFVGKTENSLRCFFFSINIFITTIIALGLCYSFEQMGSKTLLACDFEVFGIVQGVFFRKYTEKQAKSLGLRGWCMNTHEGTVKGQLEGPEKEFNEMKYWLQTKGSPTSRITKATFSDSKEISDYTFSNFVIKP